MASDPSDPSDPKEPEAADGPPANSNALAPRTGISKAILRYPHPILMTRCAPVEQVTLQLERLVTVMAETMYAAEGVGLAAPQLGVRLRLAVIDCRDGAGLRLFVNPEIIERIGEARRPEGCLSLPGLRDTVTRADQVRVRWYNGHATIEQTLGGLLAHAVQHECDHLDGTLFIDHLGPLGRRLAIRRYDKWLSRRS